VELLDESPLVAARLSSTALALWGVRGTGGGGVAGGWCVGMLLGPETTPAGVVGLVEKCSGTSRDPNRFDGCVFVEIGGLVRLVVWLVFENCIVDASIFGVLDDVVLCCCGVSC
jgi:hypothetical protein